MTSHTSVIGVKSKSYFLIAGEGRVGTARYGRALSYTTSKVYHLRKKVAVGFTGDLAFVESVWKSLQQEYWYPVETKEVNIDEVKKRVHELTLEYVKINPGTLNSCLVGGWRDGVVVMYLIETVVKTEKRKRKLCTVTKKSTEVSITEIKENYVVIGSGVKHTNKVMKENNDALENMSSDEALKLVLSAISGAIDKDWNSGGRLEWMVIEQDETGFEHWAQNQKESSYYLMDYQKPVRLA